MRFLVAISIVRVGTFYAPGHERGVRWDDLAFAIDWPTDPPVNLLEKDKRWPDYSM
jgi:dTDP-4-dehydrorhamnose 3,5-epimerase